MISDTKNETFNLYYEMPRGFNTGYAYLLNVSDKKPQEGGKNLYIIEAVDPDEFEISKYQKSFKDKAVTFKSFGLVQVVSVR